MPAVARIAALLLAAAGCVLLVVAEFSTLRVIQIITVFRDPITGGEHHRYALLVIAVAAVVMGYGGIVRGARPAQFALLVLALAALFVVLAIDLPKTTTEGIYEVTYEEANAVPRIGFWLESLGAVLLLISAVATLLLSPRESERPRGRAETLDA